MAVKIGEKYGRLTVIADAEPHFTARGRKMKMVRCLCDCGNVKDVAASQLASGKTKSCGCIAKEKAKDTIKFILPMRLALWCRRGRSCWA